MVFWVSACIVAFIIIMRNPRSVALFRRSYLRFILKPWKVVTFLVAASVMTLAAPYSGDYTWDYFDASVMSLMTFLTAPWAVGVLYCFIRGRETPAQAYVALCTMLFVSGWFYDAYILLRDGFYPPTWLYNLPLSSFLFIVAGLLWNLDWQEGRGVVYAFQRETWFEHSSGTGFKKVFWVALLFMSFVAFIIGLFVWDFLVSEVFRIFKSAYLMRSTFPVTGS